MKDMDDEIAVVHQHPLQITKALDAVRCATRRLLDLPFDLVDQGTNLARIVSARDDERGPATASRSPIARITVPNPSLSAAARAAVAAASRNLLTLVLRHPPLERETDAARPLTTIGIAKIAPGRATRQVLGVPGRALGGGTSHLPTEYRPKRRIERIAGSGIRKSTLSPRLIRSRSSLLETSMEGMRRCRTDWAPSHVPCGSKFGTAPPRSITTRVVSPLISSKRRQLPSSAATSDPTASTSSAPAWTARSSSMVSAV